MAASSGPALEHYRIPHTLYIAPPGGKVRAQAGTQSITGRAGGPGSVFVFSARYIPPKIFLHFPKTVLQCIKLQIKRYLFLTIIPPLTPVNPAFS